MDVLIKGELYLFGTVGDDLFEEGFTANDVVSALNRLGRNKLAVVHINSGGGFTDQGQAIFNILDGHPGGCRTIVDGWAASAASLIAQAGQERIMRPGSNMMIHDPSGMTLGTQKDHEKAIEGLEAASFAMAEIYASRNKRKTINEIREDMKEEVWFTAQEAVDAGYADRVERARTTAVKTANVTAFDYRLYKHAPERLVAMAKKNGWTARSTEKEQKTMTERSEAEQAEFNAAVTAEVEKQISARIEAAKTADAEAAKTAAEAEKTKAAEGAATGEQVKQLAADIAAACSLAGQPDKAADYISAGKSLSDVMKELKAAKPNAQKDVTTRNAGGMSEDDRKKASAGWAKAVDKVNARVGG